MRTALHGCALSFGLLGCSWSNTNTVPPQIDVHAERVSASQIEITATGNHTSDDRDVRDALFAQAKTECAGYSVVSHQIEGRTTFEVGRHRKNRHHLLINCPNSDPAPEAEAPAENLSLTDK